MEALDYPIEHFSLMRDFAGNLKAISAQILHHEYSYQSFGSWWMTLKHKGEVFRLVFDGRDYTYSIEQAVDRAEPYRWQDPLWQTQGSIHELPATDILSVFKTL